MDYIEQLKQQNITFRLINEAEAKLIMQKKWPIYRLLNLSTCFEKYQKTSLKGKFVSLDFSQLYTLAEIDAALSRLIMCMCSDIECNAKARLIYSVDHSITSEVFLEAFWDKYPDEANHSFNTNSSHYYSNYCNSKTNFIENNSLSLITYLENINFGTLIMLISFFNSEYDDKIWSSQQTLYEEQFLSVKRIRNIVAHQNSILSKLHIPAPHANLFMRAYLGNCGIRSTTLRTNMSKAIICDLVNLIYLYFAIIPDVEKCYQNLLKFDEAYCQKNWELISSNAQLHSVYLFLKEIIRCFYKKGLTN